MIQYRIILCSLHSYAEHCALQCCCWTRIKQRFPTLGLGPQQGLIPLFIFIGGGATMSMMYLARLALKNPDVSWDRKNNPEPWNNLQPDHQYKCEGDHPLINDCMNKTDNHLFY
uniref:Cytochrome c oxidase subunit NDUFA4 n=1 Tax=Dicentrarchus labrax TaxID=13489 RepID=A0A8C4FAT6_DICLA